MPPSKASTPSPRALRTEADNLPEGWGTVNLEECMEILDSQRVPVNSDERKDRKGDVPYYGATGQIGWIDDYLFDEELVLLGEDGAPFLEFGRPKAYIVRGKSWVNNHAHVLRALRGLTSNIYLSHYLNTVDYTDYVTGSTRLKLNQAPMRTIPVPIAPAFEQKRIVAKVEELLAQVNQVRERLARVPAILKRFRQSVLFSSCSGDWPDVLLAELIKDGPQNGLYKSSDSYGSGTPIVRIDNFYDGVIAPWGNLKRLRLTSAEIELYGLRERDLLVNRVNSMPYLGKSALVRNLDAPCVFESNMMRIGLNRAKVDPEYLIMYLRSDRGVSELRKNAKHAVNQSSINQQDVKACDVPLPSLPEQQRIVRRAEKLFKLTDDIEKQVAAATKRVEKLTQAILAKAFRGELVPTEAELARKEGRSYEPASVLLERIRKEREAKVTGRRRCQARSS